MFGVQIFFPGNEKKARTGIDSGLTHRDSNVLSVKDVPLGKDHNKTKEGRHDRDDR
jgi:hypothetical protein